MKNSKSLKYFKASFERWFLESKLMQYQAAMIFECSPSFIAQFLSNKTGVSFSQADKIAEKLNSSLVEMILEGKKIVEGVPINKKMKYYSREQMEAIEAFETVILFGGEAADSLADQAVRLAKKKTPPGSDDHSEGKF